MDTPPHLKETATVKWEGFIRSSCYYWQLQGNSCNKQVWAQGFLRDSCLARTAQQHCPIPFNPWQHPLNLTPDGLAAVLTEVTASKSRFCSRLYSTSNELVRNYFHLLCKNTLGSLGGKKSKNNMTVKPNKSTSQIISQSFQLWSESRRGCSRFCQEAQAGLPSLEVTQVLAPVLYFIWPGSLSFTPSHPHTGSDQTLGQSTSTAGKETLFGWFSFLVVAGWIGFLQGQSSTREAQSKLPLGLHHVTSHLL